MQTEHPPELLAMARRILADNEGDPTYKKHALIGLRDHTRSIQLIIAAIIETTERAAEMVSEGGYSAFASTEIAEDIRSYEHLKGPNHG